MAQGDLADNLHSHLLSRRLAIGHEHRQRLSLDEGHRQKGNAVDFRRSRRRCRCWGGVTSPRPGLLLEAGVASGLSEAVKWGTFRAIRRSNIVVAGS